MTAPAKPDPLPAFVSRQVTEANRFFLNLAPDPTSSLEVVCGGVERMRPEYVVHRSDFPYFAVELVAAGEGLLTVNDTDYRLSPGFVFGYGPGVPHTIRNDPDNGMRKYYLDFVGTAARPLLSDAGLIDQDGRWQPIMIGAYHELVELFESLGRDASEDTPLVRSICESLARLLMLKIRQLRLPAGSTRPQSYATYERIRGYIEQHFLQLSSIQEAADRCEVSPVYLSRLFNRFADCGAHQFLMRQKMNFAAGLLMSEGLLVKEVADRLGFADPFLFSRAFKRVYGVAPKQLSQSGR